MDEVWIAEFRNGQVVGWLVYSRTTGALVQTVRYAEKGTAR